MLGSVGIAIMRFRRRQAMTIEITEANGGVFTFCEFVGFGVYNSIIVMRQLEAALSFLPSREHP